MPACALHGVCGDALTVLPVQDQLIDLFRSSRLGWMGFAVPVGWVITAVTTGNILPGRLVNARPLPPLTFAAFCSGLLVWLNAFVRFVGR